MASASIARTRSPAFALLRFVVGVVLGALALWALNGQKGELVDASKELSHVQPVWILVAVLAEAASFISFGLLQRRLLRAGDVRVGVGFSTSLSVAAGAIANSVPGGPAFASVYAFRRYTRKGADDALAGWVLLATLACAALALGLLATAGVLLAFGQSTSYDLAGVIVGVLLVSALADAVVFQRKWLAHLVIAALSLFRKVTGHPRRHAVIVVGELLDHLTAVKVTWRDIGNTILAALGNWGCDCAALAASFLAVGAVVPWRGLLLAYGAAQLAANLPITPGGLGVVEGSLTIALVAFGGSEVPTVAAVVLYRIVSFWAFLPAGWFTFGLVALKERREDHRAREAIVGRERSEPPEPTGVVAAEQGSRE